ncbi:MAG: hypothetical protein LBT20_08270, partial [Clostridiales bacterium]|nr:hypothetical protein [Clostridiales bacterium]
SSFGQYGFENFIDKVYEVYVAERAKLPAQKKNGKRTYAKNLGGTKADNSKGGGSKEPVAPKSANEGQKKKKTVQNVYSNPKKGKK